MDPVRQKACAWTKARRDRRGCGQISAERCAVVCGVCRGRVRGKQYVRVNHNSLRGDQQRWHSRGASQNKPVAHARRGEYGGKPRDSITHAMLTTAQQQCRQNCMQRKAYARASYAPSSDGWRGRETRVVNSLERQPVCAPVRRDSGRRV